MDIETKVNIPKNNRTGKRDTENNYKSVPYMNGSSMKDIDAENYLSYGTGQVKARKSRGYPNPAEHYFNYISNDIQTPEHSVFERGMPSRAFNKTIARKYKERDVLM